MLYITLYTYILFEIFFWNPAWAGVGVGNSYSREAEFLLLTSVFSRKAFMIGWDPPTYLRVISLFNVNWFLMLTTSTKYLHSKI